MKKKKDYWYKKVGRKHVTAFLVPSDIKKLKELAKNKDKSLARYVTRLLEQHIRIKEKENGDLI